MKNKIRRTLLGIMNLNSIIIIFMSVAQFGAFDIKGKIALALWCGVSSLIGNCLAGNDELPSMFPAVIGIVNAFLLIVANFGLTGITLGLAFGVFMVYIAVKIRKASIRNI